MAECLERIRVSLPTVCHVRSVGSIPEPSSFHSYSTDLPFDGIKCNLANPHSNAVVDLNGDCLAGTANSPPHVSL